jgi:hypothetical protein
MSTGERTAPGSYRLIRLAPFAIALLLIFSMMSDTEAWLYAATVIGILASIAVGRTSGRAEERAVRARLMAFAQSWILVVAGASLSLLHGGWQPMVFFALVGLVSSGCFWFGCKTSK